MENSDKMPNTYSEHYGDVHLKIESKKLHSGRCQVKFYVTGTAKPNVYGYTLVEADRTLKEVVEELKSRLSSIGEVNAYYQRNLFSIRRRHGNMWHNFMIFKN